MRPNNFASFAGHFNPAFKTIPEVSVNIIETTAKKTKPEDLKIKTGVGKVSDFNAHVFNEKLGYVEEGEYLFSFVAKTK